MGSKIELKVFINVITSEKNGIPFPDPDTLIIGRGCNPLVFIEKCDCVYSTQMSKK